MFDIPPLFGHQDVTASKAGDCEGFFDMSDAGTGKTRAHLEDFRRKGGRLVVFAPKSVLQPAWGNDIDKYFPGMTYSIANANNREKAFRQKTDVVITNHDAVTWLVKHPDIIKTFDRFVVDESTAYKNPQAQRSKAINKIAQQIRWKRVMCATPNPHTVLELWHQQFLIDAGSRLGKSYYKFRAVACEPFQNGPKPEHIEWRDKPGIEGAVFSLLADCSIRHKLADCVTLPVNHTYFVEFDLSRKAKKHYDEMREHQLLELGDDEVVRALHASAVTNKLCQIASGAMYTGEESNYVVLCDERVELVMDLLEARPHSLVAFQWKHQRDQLIAAAKQRGYTYAVIDGEVGGADRNKAVEDFQGGKLKVLFAHPKSAGHGLTLTRGTTTIWASPRYEPDVFKQFNARIYRVGQLERTETIMVCARGTVDERVYRSMFKNLSAMELFLSLVEAA